MKQAAASPSSEAEQILGLFPTVGERGRFDVGGRRGRGLERRPLGQLERDRERALVDRRQQVPWEP